MKKIFCKIPNVCPHLEYCTPAWSPHYVKDKELLEKVQHRFARLFGHLRSMKYESRLDKLGLWSLGERRNRADLVEVFNICRGMTAIPLDKFFDITGDRRIRRHTYKLKSKFCGSSINYHFFSQRVITRWNALPAEVVGATSVDGFKKQVSAMRDMKMGL